MKPDVLFMWIVSIVGLPIAWVIMLQLVRWMMKTS